MKAIIVDDHPVVRLAVKIVLERNGIQVVAETGEGAEALSLVKSHQPQLVILDIGIPVMGGLEVISRLTAMHLPIKILVLSSQSVEHYAARCAQAGAVGFVAKSKDLSELEEAIAAVRAGRIYFPAEITSMMFGRAPGSQTEAGRLARLSGREMIVLQRLASGWANKQIADDLLLSNKTISTYKTRLLKKLNAHNLVELIELAKRHSIVT
ncbi:response regulator transcription factor [[Erwinia] mediterraneensis]|uniref:response regulator transcription factor n=1 Tax=[Erwinia] mediterraneensis TaxID=2161819 RepID=UPI001030B4FB|nr:response regulator transcription factor [[Erwinia] mediterraneensis]